MTPSGLPGKKTVGVPYALVIHKFFPMANAFFRNLGFNVLLSPPTNEEIIRLAQQTAQAETCYPVKLLHGHMAWLAEQGVDYIFMPSVHTMKHESSHVEHNYGCVYMQTAPRLAANALDLEQRGITLLSPVFDLDFGQEAMASAMLGVGKQLGIPKPRCLPALLSGAKAVRRHTAAVEKQGRELLASLRPDDKVLVLITRNYGLSDPVLNMGIPRLLLERGHKVITLSHLPAHDLDLSEDYPNLYWPFASTSCPGQARGPPSKPVCRLPDQSRLRPGHHALLSVSEGDGGQALSADRSGRAFLSRGRDHADRGVPPEPGGPPCPAASGGLFPRHRGAPPYCGGCRAGENRRAVARA